MSPLEAALGYLRRGWSAIPIEPRGKRPLVAWLEFQDRAATPAEVEEWFARWPEANVGIVTGHVSGLVVLDVDPAHGGADSLARLEAAHGPLAATVEDHELLDPGLPSEGLAYRLFHERGVRVFAAHPLRDACRCSDEGVESMLRSFSQAERDDMVGEDGKVLQHARVVVQP